MTDQPSNYAAEVECAIGLNVGGGGVEGVHAARDAVLALRDREMEQLRARVAELEQVSRGYCPHCGRGDAAPGVDDWDRERKRAKQAEAAIERVRAECVAIGTPHICNAVDRILSVLDQPQQPATPPVHLAEGTETPLNP